MWSVFISKEFVSRLQGKLTYVLLTVTVVAFTGMALGAFWVGLGLAGLVKFRRASARAEHVGYWTEKEEGR